MVRMTKVPPPRLGHRIRTEVPLALVGTSAPASGRQCATIYV